MQALFSWLRRREEGFTLIELLVVVAIIALLTAFAIPSLYQAINKSKTSKDTVALDTISGALERYYLDTTGYPTGDQTAGISVESAMTQDYVKKSTKFVNEFGNGFIYITDWSGTSGGSYYVLVDPQNYTSVTVICNSKSVAVSHDDLTHASRAAGDREHLTWKAGSTLSASDVKDHTCTTTAVMGTGAETPVDLKMFTNF